VARGKEQHQARLDAIQLCGKDLARRAKRKCELCEESGELRPWDSDPDVEPSLETLALLCERCRGLADGGSGDPRTMRFLEQSVWSEEPVVKALAHRVLLTVDADWARDTIDMLPEPDSGSD